MELEMGMVDEKLMKENISIAMNDVNKPSYIGVVSLIYSSITYQSFINEGLHNFRSLLYKRPD